MAKIAFLDDSFPFTGATLRDGPLGGIQTATIMLAETLAARGHHVTVHGMVSSDEKHYGVLYRPLFTPWGEHYDLLIANCVAKLFPYVSGSNKVLWMHGPAKYLRKPRHLLPYLIHRPKVVFLGQYHRQTWPHWVPLFSSSIIPHGVGEPFIDAPDTTTAPQPNAIFLSNPRRQLDWVLKVWAERIFPKMSEAQLHIYAGRSNYGSRRDDKLDKALASIDEYARFGVSLHNPLPKKELAEAMQESRVMLYRGDLGETFCFAAAEAQAVGVPLVTAGIGSLGERIIDGKTGFLREDEDGFATAVLDILRDDTLWHAQHDAARVHARATLSWAKVADAWEKLFALDIKS
jgi:glycosyltransferase involved in cell wall biosynthesis